MARPGKATGGVAPVGHPAPIRTLVDTWLESCDVVWAAAGHPHTVFPTLYAELLRITDGTPADLTPCDALRQWIGRFVDFLVTKHGLATALQSDDACFDPLRSYFPDRLVPVCTRLLKAAASSGEIGSDLDAYGLIRGIGGPCADATSSHHYDAHQLVEVLITGLRRPG